MPRALRALITSALARSVDGMTVRQLAGCLDANEGSVRTITTRMCNEGEIERNGGGRGNRTPPVFKWKVATDDA